jgi:hypothetical protein
MTSDIEIVIGCLQLESANGVDGTIEITGGNSYAEVHYVVDHGGGVDHNLIGEIWLDGGAKIHFYPATDDDRGQRMARPPEVVDLHAPNSLQRLKEVIIFWKKKLSDYYEWDK